MTQSEISQAEVAGTDALPPGRQYRVGGRRLLLHRSGSGSPAVLILPGAGAVGMDYLNLQKRVAALTTSVVYDRAGTGWSDRVCMPRTATQVTDELRDLLQVAGVPPPYVLVGHSLGGLYARHYAQRFPNEVAGLMLLDPAHEDWDAYMPEKLNEVRNVRDIADPRGRKTNASASEFMRTQLVLLQNLALSGAVWCGLTRGLLARLPVVRHYREEYRRLFTEELADWREDERDLLIERHVSVEWLWAGLRESQNVEQLYDEMRRAGATPDVPMIVLCSTGVDGFRRAVSVGESESQLLAEIEAKNRLYAGLAASVTHGEVRMVDSGHFNMHLRHPDAVARAVEDLLVTSAR